MCSTHWSFHLLVICLFYVPFRSFAEHTFTPQRPLQLDDDGDGETPLLSLHRQLVEIPSVSDHEDDVGDFLASYLTAHNFTVKKQPVKPFHSASLTGEHKQRYNVLAYHASSSSNETPVLLTAHLDTVPPYIPYSYNATSQQIAGRGTVDAKACIAAQVIAAVSLLSTQTISPTSLSLLYVVGEELGGDGMRAFSESSHPAYETVIFGEPTELKLASGHKGNLAFTVTARGIGGHSGYPWLGRNANSMLIPVLLELDQLQLPKSEKYGNTTLNIGMMAGGKASNVIPVSAHADIAVRLAAGDPEESQRRIVDAVKAAGGSDLEVRFWSKGYGPIDIDHDVEGFEDMTVNYGTDIPWLEGNHKRYLYGPGSILDAHSDHEHLIAGDLEEAVKGYQRLILAALKK
ncbi:MAG: hypothetical protein Q9220_006125 [cf. Caloplaca sp. 1 TL-2023]